MLACRILLRVLGRSRCRALGVPTHMVLLKDYSGLQDFHQSLREDQDAEGTGFNM